MSAIMARNVPVVANAAHPIAIAVNCPLACSRPCGLFEVTSRIATQITAHTAAATPHVRATFWSAPKKPATEAVAFPKTPPVASPPDSCPVIV